MQESLRGTAGKGTWKFREHTARGDCHTRSATADVLLFTRGPASDTGSFESRCRTFPSSVSIHVYWPDRDGLA